MERLGEITVADIRARLASPRSPAAETADGSEDPAADHQPGQQADIVNRLRWGRVAVVGVPSDRFSRPHARMDEF
jgi:hypothetical protein